MATKITAFILMFLIAGSARSQIIIALLFGDKLNTGKLEFGLVVTPSLTNLTNTDGKYRSGLNLGLYFNVHPEKKLFVHLEMTAKETLGAKNITPYPTGNDSLDILFSEGSASAEFSVTLTAGTVSSETEVVSSISSASETSEGKLRSFGTQSETFPTTHPTE